MIRGRKGRRPSSEPKSKWMYRILTEFKVFMYWKDPPRANRDAEPRSGEALLFVRAGLSSTRTPKNEVSIRLTQRRVKFSSQEF